MRKASLNVKKSLFKPVYTSEKVILSIAKSHFKYRKESKEYCPKISPMFGHSLPALWAVVAQYRGCRCPRGGLRMPV